MESVSVSSCRCCMFVSCVHHVAVLNAAFRMTCSLLMLTGRGCNRRPYRRGILQSRSHNCFISSHECLLLFTPSGCNECFYLFIEVCVLVLRCGDVSFGSKVRPRTFGCVAMGSALLFIVRSRLLVYSAGSGVNRVQVVLSGFSKRFLYTFAITNGVKQGCVLAPTLFSIFLSAMLEEAFKDMGDGIYIQSRQNADLFTVAHFRAKTKTTNILVRELLFADDSALIAHSAQEIQRIVDAFANASSKFGLKINIKKQK